MLSFWLLVAVVVIIAATATKGRLGINTKRVRCPRCGKDLPIVRRPANAHQAMWGGWTCSCGCEIDKWGKEIAP
jgi:hypothetical protein